MSRKLLMMDHGQLITRKEYMRRRIAARESTTVLVRAEQNCFLKNAFLFYSATEKILADDDLFFIPVPFENNLAYSGTYGFRGATLGVYVKWWQVYKAALIFAKKSWLCGQKTEPRLLYFLAGSPLSGCNRCSAVNPDGVSSQHIVPSPFSAAWRPFWEVNRTYPNEVKEARRGPYTLRDAACILREDPAVMAHYEEVMQELGLPERGELSVTTVPPSSPSCHRCFDEYDEE